MFSKSSNWTSASADMFVWVFDRTLLLEKAEEGIETRHPLYERLVFWKDDG